MSVVPVSYALVFEPDLKKSTFEVTESVLAECSKPTSTITMNCAELKITHCRVESLGQEIKSSYGTDEKREELQIRLVRKIRGTVTIHIGSRGILNDRLRGFYRSRYRQGGKTKYLATTQFEAADARRAFPCWDEPGAKATFEISIIADSRLTAISNMPVESKKKIKNRTLYKFEKTPAVSTYLVYLGVGEFEHISGRAGRTLIRVVTTRGNKSKGRFALDLGKKLLTSYEGYFGIRYPLPKLDLIAVPDFAAGAMENWGAITFRETALLYDPGTSSTGTKQLIAEVVSHEIAHQWFGNLVTMEWWNDLWLNESFATFMATKFVDKFYPEWDMWSQFVEGAMNAAMGLDSLKTTHPIDVKVDSPAEIREIFDAISYDKGGCVLRMLEDYVGEPSFRRGLRRYLSEFKYKNARGADLWDAVGRASHVPVRPMMDAWLRQPGFPLVDIRRDGGTLKLRQRRYLLEHGKKSGGGLWPIPLSIGLEKRTSARMFSKRSMSVRLARGTAGFVANHGRKGFCRVRYDDGILLGLKALVGQKRMPAVDRWAVQNDLFSLCVSGDRKVRSYLDFSDAYRGEDSYLVAANVARNLASLHFRTVGEKSADVIRGHAAGHLGETLRRLGWEPKKSDRHTDAVLRALAITSLGRMGDAEATSVALGMYSGLLRSPGSVPPDLVEPVCSVAAWNGGARTHLELVRLYKSAKTAEEKLRFLGAMCGFRDKKLLVRSLDFSQTAHVRSQNVQLPIMKVAANPHGRKVLWPWLKKNWKRISKKVGHGNPALNRIVASISAVADDSMEREIKEFFKDNPAPGTERTQAQTLERIRINSRFLRSIREEFRDG